MDPDLAAAPRSRKSRSAERDPSRMVMRTFELSLPLRTSAARALVVAELRSDQA